MKQIVIGALVTITNGWTQELEDMNIRGRTETIQTIKLFRTARILRRDWILKRTCCHSHAREKTIKKKKKKKKRVTKSLQNLTFRWVNKYDHWNYTLHIIWLICHRKCIHVCSVRISIELSFKFQVVFHANCHFVVNASVVFIISISRNIFLLYFISL